MAPLWGLNWKGRSDATRTASLAPRCASLTRSTLAHDRQDARRSPAQALLARPVMPRPQSTPGRPGAAALAACARVRARCRPLDPGQLARQVGQRCRCPLCACLFHGPAAWPLGAARRPPCRIASRPARPRHHRPAWRQTACASLRGLRPLRGSRCIAGPACVAGACPPAPPLGCARPRVGAGFTVG